MSPSETDAQVGAGRMVVERPPPGLARGRYPMPAWAIAGLGAAVVVAGLAYVATRLYRRFKR